MEQPASVFHFLPFLQSQKHAQSELQDSDSDIASWVRGQPASHCSCWCIRCMSCRRVDSAFAIKESRASTPSHRPKGRLRQLVIDQFVMLGGGYRFRRNMGPILRSFCPKQSLARAWEAYVKSRRGSVYRRVFRENNHFPPRLQHDNIETREVSMRLAGSLLSPALVACRFRRPQVPL